MRRCVLALAAYMALALDAAAAPGDCGDEIACPVADGRYLAVPPAGWDGISPLPVTVYFHG